MEGSNNAKLEVTFFKPFKGDYWVIGLDPEYRWSVVGTPDRKYLWILSRSPQLPKEELDKALAAAKAQGYELDELRYTPQK
ncbi:Outer membrane lipoprotein Blc precursor [compost metagenome]